MIKVTALNHVFFYNSKFHSKLAIYLTFSALTFLGIAEDAKPSIVKDEKSPKPMSWKIFQHNGRDYVSVKNIFKFYSFDLMKNREKSVDLIDPESLILRIAKGKPEIHVNRVLFHLAFPTVSVDDTLLVSTKDLAQVIDPVIRPSHIKGGDQPQEFLLIFDETKFTLEKKFKDAVRTAFSKRGIPMSVLISSSKNKKSEWLKSKSVEMGARVLFFEFDVMGLSENSIRTKGIAPSNTPSSTESKTSEFEGEIQKNRFDKENIALSTSVQSHILRSLSNMNDLGISQTQPTEIQNINCPSTLTEFGRLTGSNENPDKIVSSIANAIGAYIKVRTSTQVFATPKPKPRG